VSCEGEWLGFGGGVYFVLGVASSVPQKDLSLFGQVLPFS